MKKIALWGYGNHGKDMELILSESWPDRYQITAVFDLRCEPFRRTACLGLPVLDPDRAEALYRSGLFDEMLITVFDPSEQRKIRQQLEQRGIPAAELDCSSDRQPPEYFEQWEAPAALPQKGYFRFCFSGLYLRMGYHQVPVVFDGDGVVNAAYLRDYELAESPYLSMFVPSRRKPVEELRGEWCLVTGAFSGNYWHFTYETLDKIQVLENSGYKGRYLILHSAFSPTLCRLIGLDPARIVWLDELKTDVNYRIERLICPVIKGDPGVLSAPVLAEAADAVRNALSGDGREYPERLYVKRIGKRKLLQPRNWPEEHGFEVFVPEEHTTEEQIRFFMHARIVLSPHGANSTNSLYMTPGSVMIESFPHNYVNPCCLNTCMVRGVYYLMLTEPDYLSSQERERISSDYRLWNVQLDLALAAAEKLTAT